MNLLSLEDGSYLYRLPTDDLSICHHNGCSSFFVGVIPHKPESFVSLDAHFFNDTGAKIVELAVKFSLGHLKQPSAHKINKSVAKEKST